MNFGHSNTSHFQNHSPFVVLSSIYWNFRKYDPKFADYVANGWYVQIDRYPLGNANQHFIRTEEGRAEARRLARGFLNK